MRKGFTLIELLIVIAIIGILSSSLLVGLGGARKQARDARRIADLKNVQAALELYFNKCGWYPGGANSAGACTSSNPVNWTDLETALQNAKIGTNQIPNDPTTPSVNYDYEVTSDGQRYVLGATLEGDNQVLKNSWTNADSTDANIPSGQIDCDPATNHYCIGL